MKLLAQKLIIHLFNARLCGLSLYSSATARAHSCGYTISIRGVRSVRSVQSIPSACPTNPAFHPSAYTINQPAFSINHCEMNSTNKHDLYNLYMGM